MLTAVIKQESVNEEVERLRNQVTGCPAVREDVKVIVEGFLVSQEIFNLGGLNEAIVPMLFHYLDQNGIYAKAKRNT